MNKNLIIKLLLIVLILSINIFVYFRPSPATEQINNKQNVNIIKQVEQEEKLVEEVDTSTWLDNIDEKTPVLIYTQEIARINDNSGSWPTVQIMGKVGDNDPEFLAEIGGVEEYADNYKLSPDNKYLLINLRSKVKILNLATKELEDLFIPKKQIQGMSYSPDGKKLFIWDQKYGQKDKYYYAHLFDISTRKDQILLEGDIDGSFLGGTWRDDGNITMMQTHGGFAEPYYFNLATNEMIETPNNYATGLLSTSGKLMSTVKEYIYNACNEYSTSAWNLFNIIDPVTGDILGTVGGADYGVGIIAFSSDDKEVLYKTWKPWTDKEDCDKDIEYEYFIKTIETGESRIINNTSEIDSSWNNNYIGATYKHDYEEKTWSILINNKPVITSDMGLRIVGEFYIE